MVQRQDLVLFSDHTVVSDKLFDSQENVVINVTSTQATQATWLNTVLMESYLLGSPVSLNSEQKSSVAQVRNGKWITVASLVHNTGFFQANFNRLQVDSSHYKIVDLLTDFVQLISGKPTEKILLTLLDMFPENRNGMIIIEQPEILLSLIPNLTADILGSKFINALRKKCGHLVINSVIDPVQEDIETSTAVEFKRFLQSNIYKSQALIALNPLPTGRAKDVTGTLRISRGPSSIQGIIPDLQIAENEYLYLTDKDNTELFYS